MFAALLQQRGVVTPHAGAIGAGAGAVLFADRSGSGKSSLIAALVKRGYAMLADNVTGVVLDGGGRPVERFHAAPLAVRTVCRPSFQDEDGIGIEALPAASVFGWLLRSTYRGKFLRGLGQSPTHFRTVTGLARRVPSSRVMWPVRPPPFRIDALADRVEEHLQERGPEMSSAQEWRAPQPVEAGRGDARSVHLLARVLSEVRQHLAAGGVDQLPAGRPPEPASINAPTASPVAADRETFDGTGRTGFVGPDPGQSAAPPGDLP